MRLVDEWIRRGLVFRGAFVAVSFGTDSIGTGMNVVQVAMSDSTGDRRTSLLVAGGSANTEHTFIPEDRYRAAALPQGEAFGLAADFLRAADPEFVAVNSLSWTERVMSGFNVTPLGALGERLSRLPVFGMLDVWKVGEAELRGDASSSLEGLADRMHWLSRSTPSRRGFTMDVLVADELRGVDLNAGGSTKAERTVEACRLLMNKVVEREV